MKPVSNSDVKKSETKPKKLKKGTDSDGSGSDSPSEKKSKIRTDYYGEEWEGEGIVPGDYCIGIGSWTNETIEETLSESALRVLNYLESGTAISLFEDLYEELFLLKYVIGAPIVSSWYFQYETLDERYQRRTQPDRIFPEVDSNPIVTTPLKIQKDRQHLEVVIRDTLRALVEDGTFDPLITASKCITLKQADDERLIQEVKHNLVYLRDLRKRVFDKKKAEEIEEKERDELLYKLQDEIEDATFKCAIEEGFVDRWENTRGKQNRWRLKNTEDYYTSNLSELSVKTQMENRVTNEMQLFIKTNQLELEEQLEEWMTRYDEDMDRRENKILTLKYERDQQLEVIQRQAELLEGRRIEMKEWKIFREIRKKQSAACLIIQSWWRGMMVRKRIGPYKQKKKPPPPKKKR